MLKIISFQPCIAYGLRQIDFLCSQHCFIFLVAFLLSHSAPSALKFSIDCFQITRMDHVHTMVLFMSLGPNIFRASKALNRRALGQLLASSHGEPMCEAAKCPTNAIASRWEGGEELSHAVAGHPSPSKPQIAELDLPTQEPMVQAMHGLWLTL